MPPGSLTRRRALLCVAAIGAAAATSGCSGFRGDDTSPAPGPAVASALRIQLAWTRGPQFTGTFVADRRGAFLEHGFDAVTLLDGGPGLDPHRTVLAGDALYATTGTQSFAAAVAGGAPLVALGAVLRRSPYGVVVAGDASVPTDLNGARVGVIEPLVPLWRLAAGRAGLSGTESVLVDWSVTALVDGEVDALVGFVPTVARKAAAGGAEVSAIGFDAFGAVLPDQLLVTSTDTLGTAHDQLVDALRAEVAGWTSTLDDPAAAVTTTVDVYAADLGYDDVAVAAELELLDPLVRADGSPLLTLDRSVVESTAETLSELGRPVPPTAWVVEVGQEAHETG